VRHETEEAIVYVRVKTVRHGDKAYQYRDVVRSVRVDGKPRQELVASLGRVAEGLSEKDRAELLRALQKHYGVALPGAGRAKAPSVLEGLEEPEGSEVVDPDLGEARAYGSVAAIESAWRALGLDRILSKLAADRGHGFELERAVFAMVANRLIAPCSKYGTAEWLWRDVYLPTGTSLDSDHLYEALTWLSDVQSDVELAFYKALVDSKRLEATAVFYDTSTIYFEGLGPAGLAARGRPKGCNPPNKRLVLLGLVRSADGWPIAHRVFPGNTADVTTVEPMLRDLVERFGIKKFVFVCDRGMISESVIALFVELKKSHDVDYVIATKIRGDAQVSQHVLSRAGRFREVDEKLGVKEVVHLGRRYIVCRNPQEVDADGRRRAEIVEKIKKELPKHGALSAETKKAMKLLTNKSYGRYLTNVGGRVLLDAAKVEADARYDGKWVLRTSLDWQQADKVEVAQLYKREVAIERDFRELKSFIELRPMFHRLEPRARAHVFVCILAKAVSRELERRLHAGGFVGTSVDAVLKELGRIEAIDVASGTERRYVRSRTTQLQDDLLVRLGVGPLPARLPWYEVERPRRVRLDNVQAAAERKEKLRARHEQWLATKRRTPFPPPPSTPSA